MGLLRVYFGCGETAKNWYHDMRKVLFGYSARIVMKDVLEIQIPGMSFDDVDILCRKIEKTNTIYSYESCEWCMA
jgi:hypothetical protein